MSDENYNSDTYNKYDDNDDGENANSNEGEEGTSDSNQDETNSNGNENSNTENEYYWCGDIPFGFQTINPQVFNVIGEIIGDVMSNRLPYNVQNAVGNWLQLVGQIIEAYSSQQNYFQSGPGRYYNLRYYNVTNPFCSEEREENSGSEPVENSASNSENCTDKSDNEIDDIKSVLNQIQKSIVIINEKINKLENDK